MGKWDQYIVSGDSSTPNKWSKYEVSTPDHSKLGTTEMTGGANSPAMIKARQEQSSAESNVENLDPAVATVKAAYNMSWPASELARRTIGENSSVPEPTTGGGKMLGDMGMMANPLSGLALNSGGKLLGKIAVDPIKNIIKYSKPQNQVKLADEVQNAFMSQKRAAVDKYGKEYEQIIGNSTNKVDLNGAVKNFVDEAQSLMQNPEFSQQVAAKNPQAMKIFDMADKISKAQGLDSMSAKEADSLAKYIRNLPGLKSKLTQASTKGWHTVQWSNEDRMLLGLADDIKGSVIQSHPELQGLNKEYGQFMNAYKNVAPDFKIGTTISKLKNYSSYDPQKAQLLEGILPKDTVNRIKEFESADKAAELLKKIGLYGGSIAATGIGAGGAFEAGKKILH